MKNIMILLVCLFCWNSFAASVEVDVLSVDFGIEDHLQNKSLCLTVVRVPATGALLGVLEGIHDCFYARTAKRSPNHKIQLDLKKLTAFTIPELQDHLQSIDTQLKFLFSQGE